MRKTILAGTVAALLLVLIAFVVPSPGAQQVKLRPASGSTVQVSVRTGDGERPIQGVLEHFDADWLAVRLTPQPGLLPPGDEAGHERANQLFWVPTHAVIFIRVFEEE